MANVRFVKTVKEKYLKRDTYDPNALYFCEDTGEIFKGDQVYTDGIKVIPTKADLPSCPCAADGVVYYIAETKSGYVMAPDRSGWLQTIYAPVTDAYEIPEEEMYTTVTTVGAVRDIENKLYECIDGVASIQTELETKIENKVDNVDGKSLVADTEIARLAAMSDGANRVESSTNGNIKIDGVDTVVYAHPDKHTVSDVSDFAVEVAKVKVDSAVTADKAVQDGSGRVIVDTYAEKADTLAGYSIGDAYTKAEVDDTINTFISSYITSDGDAIDKLQEIANWIDSDKNGVADIIADIENNSEAIAATKIEAESKIKSLADGQVTTNKNDIAALFEILTWGSF